MNSLLKFLYSLFMTAIFSSLLGIPCYGQADIAPIALYMSDDDKTGRITVRNPTDQPIEISIDLIYGYPTTDSEGKVYLKKFQDAPEGAPSATSWIRTYPRQVILPANEQQTIRFAARPPAQLSDGEYWARPAVSVRKVGGNATLSNENQDVEANLNIIQRTILSLNYRKGQVRTGIKVNEFSSRYNNSTLYVNAGMEREGNAAYLGHIDISLLDMSGNKLKHYSEEIAVYHSQNRQFEIGAKGLAPGTYKVVFSLGTEKRYRDNDKILDARSVDTTASITVK